MAPIAGVRLACSSMWCESTKAASELGYPVEGIDQALGDLIDWFIHTGLARPGLRRIQPSFRSP
jgi:hypothetical protein